MLGLVEGKNAIAECEMRIKATGWEVYEKENVANYTLLCSNVFLIVECLFMHSAPVIEIPFSIISRLLSEREIAWLNKGVHFMIFTLLSFALLSKLKFRVKGSWEWHLILKQKYTMETKGNTPCYFYVDISIHIAMWSTELKINLLSHPSSAYFESEWITFTTSKSS